MKHLDCTLRDGGYYNAWDFSESLIKQYLVSMQAAGIDIVEFRCIQSVAAIEATSDDHLII